jgi:signal transduction histidine kinase
MNHQTDYLLFNDAPVDCLPALGAEFVFIHDARGQYLSFYWSHADRDYLSPERVVGHHLTDTFGPVPVTPYLDRVKRVLQFLIPERFSYPFSYQDRYFPLDLIITPVMTASGEASTVLVMARHLPHKLSQYDEGIDRATAYPALPYNMDLHQQMVSCMAGQMRRTLAPTSELYYKLSSQIAQKIRRTLDLETIWQQTVNSLGQFLDVSRCFLCPYQSDHKEENQANDTTNRVLLGEKSVSLTKLKVVAEYCQEPYLPMLGLELTLEDQPGWKEALISLEPIVVERTPGLDDPFPTHSVLVVATTYQDQPNALIVLHQCDEVRQWGAIELEFVRELASQVGTAIAHGTLYQELEKTRALKSQFLASISQELRTPLDGIIGFLNLIVDGVIDDPEAQHEFLLEAYNSSLRLYQSIEALFDITKFAPPSLNLAPFKLNEVLDNVENLTRIKVQEKNLTWQLNKLPTEDEVIVYGDDKALRNVLLNLVGNAIQFTKKGGMTLTVSLEKKIAETGEKKIPRMVKISILDTGIGVPLEKQDKLFQPFYQVMPDSSNHIVVRGLGLGLAISKNLIEAMKGTINFYSLGEGLGSTVTLTMPLYQEPVMISPHQEVDFWKFLNLL